MVKIAGLLIGLLLLATTAIGPFYQQNYYAYHNYWQNNQYLKYQKYNSNYYSPYRPMPSYSCSYFGGCQKTYNSHIYVRSALDYTYYTNPDLLYPRYIDNHQRYYSGLWPQRFGY